MVTFYFFIPSIIQLVKFEFISSEELSVLPNLFNYVHWYGLIDIMGGWKMAPQKIFMS